MAAFQYLSSSPRWECGSCRQRGLEESRRCGFLGYEGSAFPVWAGSSEVFFQCPESVVGSSEVYWLELAKYLTRVDPEKLLDYPAVDCDAVWALNEIRKD